METAAFVFSQHPNDHVQHRNSALPTNQQDQMVAYRHSTFLGTTSTARGTRGDPAGDVICERR